MPDQPMWTPTWKEKSLERTSWPFGIVAGVLFVIACYKTNHYWSDYKDGIVFAALMLGCSFWALSHALAEWLLPWTPTATRVWVGCIAGSSFPIIFWSDAYSYMDRINIGHRLESFLPLFVLVLLGAFVGGIARLSSRK